MRAPQSPFQPSRAWLGSFPPISCLPSLGTKMTRFLREALSRECPPSSLQSQRLLGVFVVGVLNHSGKPAGGQAGP